LNCFKKIKDSMPLSAEDVKQLLTSPDYGDRIRGVNQARYLERAVTFELLKSVASDSNPRIRYAAVSQLADVGQVNKPEVAVLLRTLLHNDPEADVRAAAADALAALRCEGAFDDLQQVLNTSSDWLIRMSIIAALGELGDPRAFDVLVAALDPMDGLIQVSAIGALGELGDPRAVPYLTPWATHEDWQIRYRVVQSLARLGGEAAQHVLAQLVDDPVEQIAQEAKLGLQAGNSV
jgi:HEAT repeat protein